MTGAGEPVVLVVDDAAINRSIVCQLLHQIGCVALAADSGPAALVLAQTNPPALVLMDCEMPGMDGYTTTSLLRQALGPGHRLPILALSGNDHPEDRARCLAAGMDDFLPKPLRLATLEAALARWLGGRFAPAPAPAPAPVAGAEVVLDPSALANFNRMQPGSGAMLLGIYLKDLAECEPLLQRAVMEGDLSAVTRAAHKLKGASLTIGAVALGAAMKALEQHARSASLPASQEAWRHAATVLMATRAAIAAAITPPPPPPTPPAPWPTLRATPEVVTAQRTRALHAEGFVACIEAMPGPAVLLNAERQILVSNSLFQRAIGLGPEHGPDIVGLRPGEALDCHHAATTPEGCGGDPACAFCGAATAIVDGLRERERTVTEARLTVGPGCGQSRDYEMTATPIRFDGQGFVLLGLRDIATEKRRQVLERLFYHDVLNSVGGVLGLATQLAEQSVPPSDQRAMHHLLAQTSQQAVDEINAQRMLTRAENGDLPVDFQRVALAPLLRELRDACAVHQVAARRHLVLGPQVEVIVKTDRVLLRRVLTNLVKNALEATPPGGTVTIGSHGGDGTVSCTVHNPGVMSDEVRLQLFQRSFTTKGDGRGLGTWSAKLLGERYLGGRLSFTSSAEKGTELALALALPRLPT